jgi:hypothetical protein
VGIATKHKHRLILTRIILFLNFTAPFYSLIVPDSERDCSSECSSTPYQRRSLSIVSLLLTSTMVKYKKRPVSARPALVRVRDVGDAVRDYEVALKRAGIKPAAYEEVFSLMVRFRDFAPNQAHFRKYAAGSSRFIARRFLKMFGERVWGTDRKYIRSGLPNGGLRYALANPDRNVGKLVDILASAFHEMRGRMFTRAVSV